VGGKLRLVVAAQSARDFCGKPPENLAAGIDQIPVAPDLMRLGRRKWSWLWIPASGIRRKRVILLKSSEVSNSFQPRLFTKKKAQPRKVAPNPPKGGGWRRQNSSSTQRALSARHEDIMSAGFVQCKSILVRCDTKIGPSSGILNDSKFNSLESDFRSNRSKLLPANTQGRGPLPR